MDENGYEKFLATPVNKIKCVASRHDEPQDTKQKEANLGHETRTSNQESRI